MYNTVQEQCRNGGSNLNSEHMLRCAVLCTHQKADSQVVRSVRRYPNTSNNAGLIYAAMIIQWRRLPVPKSKCTVTRRSFTFLSYKPTFRPVFARGEQCWTETGRQTGRWSQETKGSSKHQVSSSLSLLSGSLLWYDDIMTERPWMGHISAAVVSSGTRVVWRNMKYNKAAGWYGPYGYGRNDCYR